MQPVRLPFDQAEAVYAAYRAWAELVARPEFALRLRLAPGDCLVFDNTRILHARTAFSPHLAPVPGVGSGPGRVRKCGRLDRRRRRRYEKARLASTERHLQGCYADIDGLLSTLAVLRRDHHRLSRITARSVAAVLAAPRVRR